MTRSRLRPVLTQIPNQLMSLGGTRSLCSANSCDCTQNTTMSSWTCSPCNTSIRAPKHWYTSHLKTYWRINLEWIREKYRFWMPLLSCRGLRRSYMESYQTTYRYSGQSVSLTYWLWLYSRLLPWSCWPLNVTSKLEKIKTSPWLSGACSFRTLELPSLMWLSTHLWLYSRGRTLSMDLRSWAHSNGLSCLLEGYSDL